MDKIVKKQRKRFSKRKREIRKEVKEDMLSLVKKRIEDFKSYIDRWCHGSLEEGKKEANKERKGL